MYVAVGSVTLNTHQPRAGTAEMCVGTQHQLQHRDAAAWIIRTAWEPREAQRKTGLSFPSEKLV